MAAAFLLIQTEGTRGIKHGGSNFKQTPFGLISQLSYPHTFQWNIACLCINFRLPFLCNILI